ncbi:MAG TPA: PAS domain S-box protein [Gemmata sp.]
MSPPPPSREHVSGAVLRTAIAFAHRLGRSIEPFLAGLNRTLRDLQSPGATVSWGEYLIFLRNCAAQFTPDEFVELSASLFVSTSSRALAEGPWADPTRCFARVADPKTGALGRLFPCLDVVLTRPGDGAVVLVVTLREQGEPPPELFWDSLAIALGALPAYSGRPPAVVEQAPPSHGMVFRVRAVSGSAGAWLAARFRRRLPAGTRAVLAVAHERTQRHRAEGRLQESEGRFRQIANAFPGMVYRYVRRADGSECFPFVSAGVRDLTGIEPEEGEADPRVLWRMVPPADVPALQDTIRVSERDRTPWVAEFRIVARDGAFRWVRGRALPEPPRATGDTVWNGFLTDITAEKRAEEEARAQAARLEALAANTNAFILELDPSGAIRYANRASAGRHIRDLLGRPLTDLLAEPDREPGAAILASVFSTGHTFTGELAAPDGTGDRRTYSVALSPIRTGAAIERVALTAFDITDRVRAEAAVRQSEERFRETVEAAPDAIVTTDPQGTVQNWNRGAERVFGWTAAEAVGHTVELIIPARFAAAHAAALAAFDLARSSRMRAGVVELVAVRKGGTEFPVEIALASWGTGPDRRFTAIIRDITDRKRAEAERDELLAQLQLQIARMPLAYILYDADLRYAGWNPAAESIFGYAADEIIGRPLLTLVPPDAHEQVLAVSARLRSGDVVAHSVNRNVTKSGAVLVCEWHNTPLRRTDGTFVGVLSMVSDVTDAVRTRAALESKEQSLRLALSAGRMGTWDWELGSDRVRWNECQQALFGFTPGTFDGTLRTVLDRVHPDDRALVRRALADAEAGKDFDGAFRIQLPDGEVRWVHSTGATVPRTGDRAARFVGVSYDTTARKTADERLVTSLREKEAMLIEIHHRVKNNLQVVSSLLSLQTAQVTHPAALAVLTESQNRIRAMALVHETLYRSDDLARVDPTRYFSELVAYLFRVYGVDTDRVRLELDIAPVPLPLEKTIPCGLIVNEVVSNALKYAFPEGRPGTIRVALRERAPGGTLELALSDNGVGLPEGHSVDRAQSLGLQLVTVLTEQLGGQLTVGRSGGTSFTLSFAR